MDLPEDCVDRFTVFCRTDAGDRELAGAKGTLEKMTCSVLERVDGFSTVGELTTQIGRNRPVLRALGDLERLGLVETLDARMARVAEDGSLRIRTVQAPRTPVSPAVRKDPSERKQPTTRPLPVSPEFESSFDRASVEPPLQRALASGSRATLSDRLNALVGNFGYHAMNGGGARGRTMRCAVAWTLGIAVLGGTGVAIVALGYQASHMRLQVEREAALWLGEPVKIASVGLGFHPWPGFEMHDVQIGEDGTSRIERAWGHPDWWRWATGQTQRIAVSMAHASLQPALLVRVATLPVPEGPWRLSSVSLHDTALPIGSLQLEKLSGDLIFSEEGRWTSARLHPAEANITLEAENQQGGVLAMLHTPEYKLGQIKLENVLISGNLTPTGLSDAQFGANWLSGALKGHISMDFTNDARIEAQLDSTGIAMDKLSGLAGATGALDGRLSGLMKVEASAASFDQLATGLKVSGNYSIEDGSIRHLDLIEAMRRNGNAPISGGSTRFSRMEGTFGYQSGSNVKADIRRLDAGALSGSGRWSFGDDAALHGNLRTSVRTSAENIVRMFSLEGSLQTPRLRPIGE